MMIACVTIMHGLKTVLNHQARESISFMLCLDLGFVTQFVEGNEKVREMQLQFWEGNPKSRQSLVVHGIAVLPKIIMMLKN